MSLNENERQIIVQRELIKAHEAFDDLELLAQSNRWSGAAIQ